MNTLHLHLVQYTWAYTHTFLLLCCFLTVSYASYHGLFFLVCPIDRPSLKKKSLPSRPSPRFLSIQNEIRKKLIIHSAKLDTRQIICNLCGGKKWQTLQKKKFVLLTYFDVVGLTQLMRVFLTVRCSLIWMSEKCKVVQS